MRVNSMLTENYHDDRQEIFMETVLSTCFQQNSFREATVRDRILLGIAPVVATRQTGFTLLVLAERHPRRHSYLTEDILNLVYPSHETDICPSPHCTHLAVFGVPLRCVAACQS